MLKLGDVIMVRENDIEFTHALGYVVYDKDVESVVVIKDNGGWDYLDIFEKDNREPYEISNDITLLSDDLKKTLEQECYKI